MKAVLIGEAYGAREDMFKHPFVGSSGKELASMVSQTGLGPELNDEHPSELDMIAYWKRCREDYGLALTNVFQERPPYNDVTHFFTNAKEGLKDLGVADKGKYLKPTELPHLERLWQEIKALAPNLVVCLGNVACWAILGHTGIGAIRGTVSLSQRLNVKVLPTYHPAAVMRSMPLRPIVIADLSKAKREAEFPEIRRIERWIIENPTLSDIKAWMTEPANYYSIDIESGRALYTTAEIKHMPPNLVAMLNEQISMIGFARDPHHALVIPFMTRAKDDMCYWPDFDTEFVAWQMARELLETPVPKIFQNGMYDVSRLLAYALRPRLCSEDTMLLHHALYPEMPKKLGFLGSIYSDEIAWKEMYSGGENLKRDD